MKIEANRVVSIHYRTSADGEEIDSSFSRGEPLSFLVGHRNVIAGLEEALMGREAGEKLEVTVEPAKAYGERRANAIQRVPKKYFENPARLKPGMTTVLQTREAGARMVTVHKVGSSVIDVDLNHPLAGKALHFEVEITGVREADKDEIAHGHAHGKGGHEH